MKISSLLLAIFFSIYPLLPALSYNSKKWILAFEHENLPSLDGNWLVTKKTIKRMNDILLIKPVTFIHANSRLPFEKRDFKDKEVVISSQGPDSFAVRAIYPVTDDVYYDPNQDLEIKYQNFGLKAVIDPKDITYAYTLKLDKPIENPTLARQLWLNGRLNFKYLSSDKIIARGYEVEYTPELAGYLLDEVEFEFVRGGPATNPLIQQLTDQEKIL